MYVYINIYNKSNQLSIKICKLHFHILHHIGHKEITFLIGLGITAFKFVYVSVGTQTHNVPRACFVGELRSNVFFAASLCPDSWLGRWFQLLFGHALPHRVVHKEVHVISALDKSIDRPVVRARMGRKGT